MEQFNPLISRIRRVLSAVRVFAFPTFVGAIVLVVTLTGFSSHASKNASSRTKESDVTRKTLPSSGLSGLETSALAAVCTSDPVVVNSLDSGAGSLRQAIADACEASTITFSIPTSDPGFSGGVYIITLTTADLVIAKNLTITGLGASILRVRRSAAGGIPEFRIFTISEGSTATISALTVTNGNADTGGGILNSGTLTLNDCRILNNVAGNGGGVQNIGTLTVNRCNVTSNSGGGIFNHFLGGPVEHLTAVSTLTVNNSTISGNTIFGGIYNDAVLGATAKAFINSSTISQNTASVGVGGGISNVGLDSSPTTMTIINSTISANNSNDSGGGISNSSARNGSVTLNIINSTISGNSDTTKSGGIYQQTSDGGSVTSDLTNATISANSAGVGGTGGILLTASSTNTLTMRNSIVAGNFLTPTITPNDISGTVQGSSSFNLVGNGTGMVGISNGSNGNQVGTAATPLDPLLGVLANNGVVTQSHLPLPRSPAINAGSNALLPADTFDVDGDSNNAETLPVDQRGPGFSRIVNGTVDIGAVEANYSISAVAGTPQSASVNSSFATALGAMVTESGNNQNGIPVTFTAPLLGASGRFVGNVTTIDATTNAAGVAAAPAFTANATPGSYDVSASIGAPISSANFALTNAPGATTTALSSSINPSQFGQSVTFTATVTSAVGTPTGTVQFRDGGANVGSPQVLTGGAAQLTTSALTAGTHVITADYSGDVSFAPSSGSLSGGQVVQSTPALQLILDESGPGANQATALDSISFLRDPFKVRSVTDWLIPGLDRNTRVKFFAANLQLGPGETASSVVVTLVDGHNQTYDVPAEDVRTVPNFSFTQVVVRLPDTLAPGLCSVTVKAQGKVSNTGTVRIVL